MVKFLKNRFDIISLGLLIWLGPLFVFPRQNWDWVLLAGVAAIFFGRGGVDGNFLKKTPIDAAMALLVLWSFFGVLATHNLAGGATKLKGLIFGIVVFYSLIGAMRSVFRIKIAVVIFISMSVFVSLIGTLSRSDGSSIPQIDNNSIVKSIPKVIIKFDRAEAGINPNPLGGTLLLFVPSGLMAFSAMLKKDKKRNRFIRNLAITGMAIILGVDIFAIQYSRSYGAWAAFGFILLFLGKKGRRSRICLALATIFALFPLIKSPSLSKNALISDVLMSIKYSSSTRMLLWKEGLVIAHAHPIFGVGVDRLRITPPYKYEYAHAHSQFIHMAAEMGIPALIAYLAILIGVGWMTIEVTRSKMPEGMILIMRGLAWGQIGFAIFGIADAIPLGSKPGIFFWYSLALMTSIYLYGKNKGLLSKADIIAKNAI